MPAQAGTQFFAIRCEIRWVPACAGMTEADHPRVKSGSYFGTDSKFKPSTEVQIRRKGRCGLTAPVSVIRLSNLALEFNFDRFRHLSVAEAVKYLQHFAPRRKLPTTSTLVIVHCPHELDFGIAVVTLAGCWINLPTPFHFGAAFWQRLTSFFFVRRFQFNIQSGCYGSFGNASAC
jgi:hypothetical protein